MQTVNANPYLWLNIPGGTMEPDWSTKPPIVTIHSQQNVTYISSNITFPIEAIVGASATASSKHCLVHLLLSLIVNTVDDLWFNKNYSCR
jgi:hypothetical protein